MVLVVDDDTTLQSLLKSILEEAGLEVVTAVDVNGGVAALTQFRPRAVVLDFSMPGGGAPEFLRLISTPAGVPVVPVLIYSAKLKSDVEKAVPLGNGVSFLMKPVDLDMFIATVKAMVGPI